MGLGRRNLVHAKPGTGGPKLAYGFALAASTSVDSHQREFLKIRPGAVAMVARRIVATTEEGGRP